MEKPGTPGTSLPRARRGAVPTPNYRPSRGTLAVQTAEPTPNPGWTRGSARLRRAGEGTPGAGGRAGCRARDGQGVGKSNAEFTLGKQFQERPRDRAELEVPGEAATRESRGSPRTRRWALRARRRSSAPAPAPAPAPARAHSPAGAARRCPGRSRRPAALRSRRRRRGASPLLP
ncbi:putative HTLV-1-related endogenous sequence [Cervus elaphus]|uniref:putative HTLV-1-related endogenous sequence n=1 Tax=Cervus elaphus TaxID=9860 RepID=UPI001CC32472|nr:putative HTLV-1-related endogenous sequence [Cervus elaphus]